MRPRVIAGICSVLAKHRQSVFSRFRVKRAKDLLQITIDRQRPLLAGHILDACDDCSTVVDKSDALNAIDRRQLSQIFFERRTWLDHFRHFSNLSAHSAEAGNSFPEGSPARAGRAARDDCLADGSGFRLQLRDCPLEGQLVQSHEAARHELSRERPAALTFMKKALSFRRLRVALCAG